MRIHSEFFPLAEEWAWMASALNGGEADDGAYARVCPLDDSRVLKATSCEATNKLFNVLHDFTTRNHQIPEALPAVLGYYGRVVRDTDGIVYTTWVVERLYRGSEEAATMRRARVSARAYFDHLKPEYVSRPVRRLNEVNVQILQAALEQEQSFCRSPNTWQGSADIALAMSLRTSGELKKAFTFLLHFVSENRVQLDLLTRGNIMVNMYGEPCLGDPVCTEDEKAPAHEPLTGPCVGLLLPKSVQGIQNIVLEPASSLPLDEPELVNVENGARALGLKPCRYDWGSDEHRSFLAQAPVRQSIWTVPFVARRLREGLYEKLLTT